MKIPKYLLLVIWAFLAVPVLYGQLSFSERKLRDKTYNEGIAYIQQGQYELAAASFMQCIELDSTFAPAWLQKGRILIEWGVMEDALAQIDTALFFNPEMGEAYFYKGYVLYGIDTTGMDRSLFDQAISQGFTDPWAYYYRGITSIREGLYESALEDFNKAIGLREDFALAYHERAGVKRKLGDLQGAHFDYQQALAYQDDFALAYNNMGSVKILMGDYEGAIADYSKALELDPSLYIALNNRGYARYYTEDVEGALKDFNAAITNSEHFAQARLNKASLLAGQGQLEPALSLLDGTLEEYPDNALLYLNRGLIRELLGDPEGACTDWYRAQALGAEEAAEYLKECGR
jgi:tetratricopeptide (TPR) repeat protein